jgi:hypothetical protein
LNTNGYGPLLNLFGNVSSAASIPSNDYLSMEPSGASPYIKVNSNAAVKARYSDGNLSSPLIMTAKQGGFTLVYVNIYPLISQNANESETYRMLGNLLRDYVDAYTPTTVSAWFSNGSLLFTSLKANGTVSIETNSIITGSSDNITINGDYSKIVINSNQIQLQNGYGFYSIVTALNPSITVDSKNVASMNGSITFVVRQPKLRVDGKIEFENFYMMHASSTYTDGRTVMIDGRISLDIYVSDSYTIALPYKFESPITVTYPTPLIVFDETASLQQLLPYLIFVTSMVLVVVLIQRSVWLEGKRKEK